MLELTPESWNSYILFLKTKGLDYDFYRTDFCFYKIKAKSKTWEDYLSLFNSEDDIDKANAKLIKDFLFNRKVAKWLS